MKARSLVPGRRAVPVGSPFVLPCHVALSTGLLRKRGSPSKLETVGVVDGFTIVRPKKAIAALSEATEPTALERLNSIGVASDFKAGDLLASLAGTADGSLEQLFQRARRGDGQALWIYAEIVIKFTERLCSLARANPKALRPLARAVNRWPLMRDRNPKNSDPDTILTALELGDDLGMQSDRFSKWKPDFACSVAGSLILRIKRLVSEGTLPLPAFTRETVPKWWKVAEAELLRSYPAPETIAELDALCTEPSKRRTAGRRRAAILFKIKRRFEALAPCNR